MTALGYVPQAFLPIRTSLFRCGQCQTRQKRSGDRGFLRFGHGVGRATQGRDQVRKNSAQSRLRFQTSQPVKVEDVNNPAIIKLKDTLCFDNPYFLVRSRTFRLIVSDQFVTGPSCFIDTNGLGCSFGSHVSYKVVMNIVLSSLLFVAR